MKEILKERRGDVHQKPLDIFIDGGLTSSLIGMREKGLLVDAVYYDISHHYSGSDGHKIIEYQFRDFQVDSLRLNLKLIKKVLNPSGVLFIIREECQSEQVDGMLNSVFGNGETGIAIHQIKGEDHRNVTKLEKRITPYLKTGNVFTLLDLKSQNHDDINSIRDIVHSYSKLNTYIYLNPDAQLQYSKLVQSIEQSQFYRVETLTD